jgi:hypothetical protein
VLVSIMKKLFSCSAGWWAPSRAIFLASTSNKKDKRENKLIYTN